MSKFRKSSSFFIKTEYLYKNRTFMLLMLLISVAAIPITVWQVQKAQNYKQEAMDLNVELSESLPTVNYDLAIEAAQMQRKTTGRKSMSSRDLSIRASIISKVPTSGDNQGIGYVGNNVAIYYDPISDEFTADILNGDINAAKTEAEDWLKQQGLSKYAVCNLPLAFYMTPEVADVFPTNTAYSTEPLSCR